MLIRKKQPSPSQMTVSEPSVNQSRQYGAGANAGNVNQDTEAVSQAGIVSPFAGSVATPSTVDLMSLSDAAASDGQAGYSGPTTVTVTSPVADDSGSMPDDNAMIPVNATS
jgi:hypothetical protein